MDGIMQYILLANATLLAAFLCAWVIEKTAILVNLSTAYRLRLHLAVAALCAAALPILLSPFAPFFATLVPMNGTDILVSQYLKGNISLSATQISDVLTAKNTALEVVFYSSSSLSVMLFVVFGIAAIWRLAYIFVNILRIKSHIHSSHLMMKTKRTEIRYSDQLTVPFSTRGFFKYFIIIPTNIVVDQRALRIAVGHEAQHIRQGDVNWEILLSFISPLFTLNPAFWLLTDRIRQFREYTCDAAFLKKGTIAAREYCLLLLSVASEAAKQNANKNQTTHPATVPFFGRDSMFQRSAKNSLRKRILALTNGSTFLDEGIGRVVNFAPAFMLFVVVSAGVMMSSKPTDWSQDRLMLSTVVNLERLDRINGFGTVPLR